MASRYGGKIVTDGLVLCLDAHDAKSYAGEPTTNLAASAGYPNFSNWAAEGTAEKISAGYNFQGQPVYKCNTSVGLVYQGINRTITGLRTAASGGSVTVSVWVKNPNSTSYNFYAYIGHDFSSTRTLEANSDWQRIEWTVLESSMANDHVEYRPYTNTSGVYIHMTMPQVEVKTYATPWVDDSRSATNGWVDRTTNNNDGTLVNGVNTGVSHYRDGQVIMPVANSYLEFDGTNDYGTVGSSIIPNSTSSYSVLVWCKRDRNSSGYEELLSQWTYANSSNSFFFGFHNSNVRFTDNWHSVTVSGAGDTSNWMHLVGVYSITNAYIYLNGSLAATKGSGFSYTGTGNLIVGRQGEYPYEYFDGKIASIQIYNKALTAAEVLSNYNATKGRFS